MIRTQPLNNSGKPIFELGIINLLQEKALMGTLVEDILAKSSHHRRIYRIHVQEFINCRKNNHLVEFWHQNGELSLHINRILISLDQESLMIGKCLADIENTY